VNEEIRNFQIMVFTMDMIAEQAPTTQEADELIKLAASYEPSTTETD
jgi:hypothetical protein